MGYRGILYRDPTEKRGSTRDVELDYNVRTISNVAANVTPNVDPIIVVPAKPVVLSPPVYSADQQTENLPQPDVLYHQEELAKHELLDAHQPVTEEQVEAYVMPAYEEDIKPEDAIVIYSAGTPDREEPVEEYQHIARHSEEEDIHPQ